ncbi:TetR/AcrR family transcriptional regulator [Geosporobacter ferrireducens]|uniref:HTH tetR-type domain-containing protein n=2 Tax=Geosporobacter ferrireducens TaxID=1424294 RepID=A0A1D8GL35_9FIRM|nr:TetR/AcrR family transcriptional regulator [Geosporobacter ferrireducens]AOT71611.1 hypothetical protein Gferi_19975 [Geosporobacter ferrireducens]
MQVLKDDVRNAIHQSALVEFQEKGFKNASMRSIAERGGMTVGNLYRYFNSKEDLFYAVISPAYHKIIDLTQEQFIKMENAKAVQNFFEYIADRIMTINREHRRELLILIDGCEETRFEHAIEEIILLVENKFRNQVFPRLKEKGVQIPDEFFACVLSASLVEGIKVILKHYEDEAKMKPLVHQFIHYHLRDLKNRLL